MILRTLQARVLPGDAPALFRRVRELVDARPAGLVHVTWATQEDEDATRLLVASTWQDLDAVYAAVGGRNLLWDAVLFRGFEDRLLEVDVQHYSVLGSGRPGEIVEPATEAEQASPP